MNLLAFIVKPSFPVSPALISPAPSTAGRVGNGSGVLKHSQIELTIILISIILDEWEYRLSPPQQARAIKVESGGENFMRSTERRTKNDGPPVTLLLAVLSWLTSRSGPLAGHPNTLRVSADKATRVAIAHHFHLLVLHPASDSIDIEAGIYMADRAGVDTASLLARFPGVTRRLH